MADSVKQALNKDETGVVLGYVINYVVTALDTLCKNPTAVVGEDEKDIENFLYVLYEDMLHKAILWLSRRRKI